MNLQLHTNHIRLLSLICGILAIFASRPTFGQETYNDYVILVGLNIQSQASIKQCYTNRFDGKKAKIEYQFEDTINYLSDFIYEEEELFGPECFIPEIKLIFRHYTYVISLHCSAAIKYKNASPFSPSSTRMSNDLIFTESVYDFLMNIREKYLHDTSSNQALIDQILKPKGFDESVPDDLDGFLFEEEPDDEFDDEFEDDEDDWGLYDDDGDGGGK